MRRHLLPPLAALLIADGPDAAGRRTITGLYGDYARGLPASFAPLEKEAAVRAAPEADHDDRLAHERRRVNAAVALASLGNWQSAQELLRHSSEPTVRTYLIDRLGPGGAEAASARWTCSSPTAMSRSAEQPCWRSESSTKTVCRYLSGRD